MTSVQYWLRFPDHNNLHQKAESQKAQAGKSAEKGLETQIRQSAVKAAESLSSRASNTRITRSHARRTVSSEHQSNNDALFSSYPANIVNRPTTRRQRNKQLNRHVIDTENPSCNNSPGKRVQNIATDSSRTKSPCNKKYRCDTCQCRFPSKKDLERHSQAFCCSVCGQLFTTKSAVRLHIDMIHKGLKPFSCDICQKSFALRKHLRGHVNAVHKRLQPFTCHFCQKKFSRKDNLKTHENSVHLQGKKFSCLICSESFTLKHSLKSHISEVHDKIKPFSCDVCKKSFARKYHLKVHKCFKDFHHH